MSASYHLIKNNLECIDRRVIADIVTIAKDLLDKVENCEKAIKEHERGLDALESRIMALEKGSGGS